MSKFPVKEVIKEDGNVLYTCAACDRKCKPPRIKQRGRPKNTVEKYEVKITEDERTHEGRYCSSEDVLRRRRTSVLVIV